MDNKRTKDTKSEAEFFIDIENYGEAFKKCVLFLNKELKIPTQIIAKEVKAGKPEDIVNKYKIKLDNTKYGKAGKHVTKNQLFEIINAYPQILKPFLGIESPYVETDLAVLKKEVEYLKERIGKLEEDNKGMYKLIIDKLT